MSVAEEMKKLSDSSKVAKTREFKAEVRKKKIIKNQEKRILNMIRREARRGNYGIKLGGVKYLEEMIQLFKDKGFKVYNYFEDLRIDWENV